MFGADRRIENIATVQQGTVFLPIKPVKHFDYTIKHNKNFFTVIDMSLIGLVSPVQSGGYSVHIGDIFGTPGPFGGKLLTTYNVHNVAPLLVCCASLHCKYGVTLKATV